MIANIILCILIPFIIIWIGSILYLLFGLFRFFYHDILNWHKPADDEIKKFDGCNIHCICKYCGKEIMQDSQGNWF